VLCTPFVKFGHFIAVSRAPLVTISPLVSQMLYDMMKADYDAIKGYEQ
jgi:hypothetical protein